MILLLPMEEMRNKRDAWKIPYPNATEAITKSSEVRALLGYYELIRTLRYKIPTDTDDRDLERSETKESIGDHMAMSVYLLHYFLPLLENDNIAISYEHALDITLANDLAEAVTGNKIGVSKTQDDTKDELRAAASLFHDLPSRGMFGISLAHAYKQYLERTVTEARLVRAVGGLATMFYILWKPEHQRHPLIAGNGYTLADYDSRIGAYCAEFPAVNKIYLLVREFFRTQKYFAETTDTREQEMTPANKTIFFEKYYNMYISTARLRTSTEQAGLLRFYNLKQMRRFGEDKRFASDHHDSVSEHIALLLLLARYFVPLTQGNNKQKNREKIHLRDVIEILLAHDAPEGITSDVRWFEKDATRETLEIAAGVHVATHYTPRNGAFNKRFIDRLNRYESEKIRTDKTPNSATLAKALDCLEAEMQIFNPSTREKTSSIEQSDREKLEKKIDTFAILFPAIKRHINLLRQLTNDEHLSFRQSSPNDLRK